MNRVDWVRGGQTVSFERETIWYRVDGAGPTLFFCHGFPTSSHDYADVIGVLAGKYRCVSFDFLGFGASSKPRREYSYELQHEVMARVAEAAGITRALLILHDYAVTLGQDILLGLRVPFVVDGIVFLNGGLDPNQHRARPIQRFLTTGIGQVLGPRLLNRRAVLAALREVFARKERLPGDDAWDSIASGGGLAVMPRLLHYIGERRKRRESLVAALRSRTVPTAFIWGMDDPVSGAHVLDAVRPLIAPGLIHELRGVGHYPQLEAPEEVARFIDEAATAWLDQR